MRDFATASALLVFSLSLAEAQPTRSTSPIPSTSTNHIPLTKRSQLKRADGSIDWAKANVSLRARFWGDFSVWTGRELTLHSIRTHQAHLARAQTKYAGTARNMERNAPDDAARVLVKRTQHDAAILARRAWATPQDSLEWGDDSPILGERDSSDKIFGGSAGVIRGAHRAEGLGARSIVDFAAASPAIAAVYVRSATHLWKGGARADSCFLSRTQRDTRRPRPWHLLLPWLLKSKPASFPSPTSSTGNVSSFELASLSTY